MKVLASPQANIINPASNSVASPSLANNPANPSLSVNTAQLTAPVNPNNNNSSPQASTVIYVDTDANKPVPPWVRLLGLTLATAGVASGIFLGARHFENRKIRNAITSHIEKYTSPNNLHIANSIEPRRKIYELCQELLNRSDISQESKNDIKTFLDALNIDHTNGNIRETHFLSENGDHHIRGLTEEHIQRAGGKLEDLFSLECDQITEVSDETFDDGEFLREIEKRDLQKRTKEAISRQMEKLIDNHKDTDILGYELNNPHLFLKVLVNPEMEVLNPKNNESFTKEGTDFSHLRFTSLIPQATTPYSSTNSFLDSLMWFELFDLAFRR